MGSQKWLVLLGLFNAITLLIYTVNTALCTVQLNSTSSRPAVARAISAHSMPIEPLCIDSMDSCMYIGYVHMLLTAMLLNQLYKLTSHDYHVE